MNNFERIKQMNISEFIAFLVGLQKVSNEWCKKLCPHSPDSEYGCEQIRCQYIDDAKMYDAWLKTEVKGTSK